MLELLWTSPSSVPTTSPFLNTDVVVIILYRAIVCWVCVKQITCLLLSQIYVSRETVLKELHPRKHPHMNMMY